MIERCPIVKTSQRHCKDGKDGTFQQRTFLYCCRGLEEAVEVVVFVFAGQAEVRLYFWSRITRP